MVKGRSPCYNCPDREIGCHGRCERYKAFQEENAKRLAWEHEQTSLNRVQAKREISQPMRISQNQQKRGYGR